MSITSIDEIMIKQYHIYNKYFTFTLNVCFYINRNKKLGEIMYSKDFIISNLLSAMKEKSYGFKNINKQFINSKLSDWDVVETIEVSKNKVLNGFDTIVSFINNAPHAMAINNEFGDFELLKLNKKGYIRVVEYKKGFNLESLSILDNDIDYHPYIYVFECDNKIYFPYKYKTEEIFNVSIVSYLSPDDDIDTYVNEKKNRNYFKTILNDKLLSYNTKSSDYKEILKSLFKKENTGIDDTIEVFNKIKSNFNEQDTAVIEELIEEINLTHYSINNGGDCGSFLFSVKDIENETLSASESFSLIVKENFYNNDEICEYDFMVKREYLIDHNYLKEAVNTTVLMFAPLGIEK